MKTVVIISTITFAVLFGVIVVTSGLLQDLVDRQTENLDDGRDDVQNIDRLFTDLANERDRVQRETERLIALRETIALEEKMLQQHQQRIAAMIDTLDASQARYGEERMATAGKLAKVYEMMKPAQAAPILAGLEVDVVLDIMGLMKERPAARILSCMDAGLAAEISRRMSLKGDRG